MLHHLQTLLAGPLQEMLGDPHYPWKTVDVTYEDPHVERVWTQWGENRVSLHAIYPCETPLFHPHPWPSAVRLFCGAYEMGVGRSLSGALEPIETIRLRLSAGAQYEMTDRHGWHWIKPLLFPTTPVMSVMVTGKPWEMPEGFPVHGKGHVHKELSDDTRDGLLNWFRLYLGVIGIDGLGGPRK